MEPDLLSDEVLAGVELAGDEPELPVLDLAADPSLEESEFLDVLLSLEEEDPLA